VTTPCARNGWCTDHETDSDGTELCHSADVELASGWMLTLLDCGNGPEIEVSDPHGFLQVALIDPLSLTDAMDLLAALAAMVRDATAPGALPQAARSPAGAA
jgi:hypothetical protein